ncbi:hypothetical protein O9G_003910 [Rozella allomycis CSF55]|uniref:Uncharacterized protein n=1 Tax=Rozella allomycis (strain CSF55) TaxID=988480 RepID=A0A075AXF9_ROZAC|nr:hypothetical protein O9G_003910 [Rozella allomycis CSF55]|eukprot:EPZ33407.1 hypothetical protein O9G_003910 [Rozella allomycis CSF55]
MEVPSMSETKVDPIEQQKIQERIALQHLNIVEHAFDSHEKKNEEESLVDVKVGTQSTDSNEKEMGSKKLVDENVETVEKSMNNKVDKAIQPINETISKPKNTTLALLKSTNVDSTHPSPKP